MKKQTAKFISNYFMEIIAYPSLIFVYTTDSMIALTFYSIIVHMIVIVLGVELRMEKEDTCFSKFTCKRLKVMLLETVPFLIILALTEHWYTFIVTCVYWLLMFTNVYDRVNEKKEEDYCNYSVRKWRF